IGFGIPIGLAEALEGGEAEVVRHDARDLPVPGSLGVRLLELLIDSAKEREPDRGPGEAVEVLHLETTAGAGVVPGCVAGIPFAQSGQSAGAYDGISRRQREWTGTSRRVAPPDRSTRTAAPETAAPADRTAAIV